MFERFKRSWQEQRERGALLSAQQELQEDVPPDVAEAAFNRKVLTAVLTGTTAVIHISLGGQLFVLNGLGFLALLAADNLVPERESYQKYTRGALFNYTGLTFAGYFALRGLAGFSSPVGMATKLVELGLLQVLREEDKVAGAAAERSDASALLAASNEDDEEWSIFDDFDDFGDLTAVPEDTEDEDAWVTFEESDDSDDTISVVDEDEESENL